MGNASAQAAQYAAGAVLSMLRSLTPPRRSGSVAVSQPLGAQRVRQLQELLQAPPDNSVPLLGIRF